MSTVAIIILTYNCLKEATKPCLESIYAAKNETQFEIVVVDNLSTDGTQDFLQEFAKSKDNFKVILNDKNYGYAAGNNIGIKSIEADYYILLNNDTIVTDYWIDKFVKFFSTHPKVGMIGPVSNSIWNEQLIHIKSSGQTDILKEGMEWTQCAEGDYFHTSMLGFFCVAITKEVINKVGLLDEVYGLGTVEDDDYCLRAINNGYNLVCLEDVFIYHKGSTSFNSLDKKLFEQLNLKNIQTYESKFDVKYVPRWDNRPFVLLLKSYLNSLTTENVSNTVIKFENKLQTIMNLNYGELCLEYSAICRSLNDVVNQLNQSKSVLNTTMEELGDMRIQFEESKSVTNDVVNELDNATDLLRQRNTEWNEIKLENEILQLRLKKIHESDLWSVANVLYRLADTIQLIPICKLLLKFKRWFSSPISCTPTPPQALPSSCTKAFAETDSMTNSSFLKTVSQVAPEHRSHRYSRSQSGQRKRKSIAYFTNMLLDWHDQRPRYGGGEKYCLNLSTLFKEQGFDIDIYQIAPTEFSGDYHGFNVRSIRHGAFYSEFNLDGANDFYEISLKYDHVIYNMPELSAGKMRMDAISICHGIWFDHDNYGPASLYRKDEWFRHLFKAFNNPKRIVSVDTNSINVIRSLWPELAQRMSFIPNFVDINQFTAPTARSNSKLKILFPRRSQINRGSRILGDILSNVPHDVEFFWVGEGDDTDTQLILNLASQDRRLKYEKASFSEMPAWYRSADIVVIPTIACEGTSLSCIEALASGCATIATNVGGLPDIIQDGVNGKLVDPNPISIATAINELVENESERTRLQNNGVDSSRAFALERWREKWLRILKNEGWIPSPRPELEVEKGHEPPKTVIITRNAIHGGVESLIRLESQRLDAPVIVAGGINNPDRTCPFPYKYIETYDELLAALEPYDVILYHWPLDWTVQAIKDSGIPSIEYVHRTDTADCDKSVPTSIVTHSDYIIKNIHANFNRSATLVPNVVDTDRFRINKRESSKPIVIGAVTSYYSTKGLDIFIQAWAKIKPQFQDIKVVFYGAGTDLDQIESTAHAHKLHIEFNPPIADPSTIIPTFNLFISPSRIEGLPIAVLEALACGVPVLASDIQGHRIINDMAIENGFSEPLTLFRSEDPDDLAEKIVDFFMATKPSEPQKLRDVIEGVFSPNQHISALKTEIARVYSSGSMFPRAPLTPLQETYNTGTPFLSLTKGDGFFFVGINESLLPKDAIERPFNFPISYDYYLRYRHFFCRGSKKISCFVRFVIEQEAEVFIQYDWFNKKGEVTKMAGIGRNLLHSRPHTYLIQDVPPDIDSDYMDIIFRPNPGQSLLISSITTKDYGHE